MKKRLLQSVKISIFTSKCRSLKLKTKSFLWNFISKAVSQWLQLFGISARLNASREKKENHLLTLLSELSTLFLILDTGSVHVKKNEFQNKKPGWYWHRFANRRRKSLIKLQVNCFKLRYVKTKVHLILKRELELFPYKSQDERLLTDRARAERLSFCQNFLEKAEDSTFLKNVLFTEAIFDMNPIINKQNCRHWSKVKPSPVAFKTSFPAKQMVWIGFTKSFIIGPYFFSKNVNADSYCEMIESFVLPKLKENRKLSHTIFQQDGARPHTANKTLDLLHDSFPAGIITRGSEFCWPAYSPDLSPVDFAFWGYLKSKIYGRNFSNLESLRQGLMIAMEEIQHDFYSSSIDSMLQRCAMCIACEGDVFENCL